MRISFPNQQHLDRFIKAVQSIGKIYDGDKIDFEYGAALYILSGDEYLLENASKYMSRHGIRFDQLLKNVHLSGGYTVLVEFAANLFGHDIHVDPIELMRLDENNFNIALMAIQFRYWGGIHAIRLSDLEVMP